VLLLEAAQTRPLILEAAMGTRLIAAGLDLQSDDSALWNLTRPDAVRETHRRDVAAGADAVVTNTFGANRAWLERFGRAGAVESINRCACALARAASDGRFVLGGIGPAAARQAGAAAEQAAIVADAGVDTFFFETFALEEIEPVLAEVDTALGGRMTRLVSLRQWPDLSGPAARRLLDLGASALGMNCRPGVTAALKFVRALDRVVSCPLLVKPNAAVGDLPKMSPEEFAAAYGELRDYNARFLGGCCGTTERHLKALFIAREAHEREMHGSPTGAGT
jgi:methionine synthase I (cobalamin-dependent)